MTTVLVQCMVCANFNNSVREKNVCSAFPDGIPSNILLNEVDHRQPVDGDNGIQFRAIEGEQHPMAKEK